MPIHVVLDMVMEAFDLHSHLGFKYLTLIGIVHLVKRLLVNVDSEGQSCKSRTDV